MFEVTITDTVTGETSKMTGDAVFAVTNRNADNNGQGFIAGQASFAAAVNMLTNMVGLVESRGAAPKGAIALATAQFITRKNIPTDKASLRRILHESAQRQGKRPNK